MNQLGAISSIPPLSHLHTNFVLCMRMFKIAFQCRDVGWFVKHSYVYLSHLVSALGNQKWIFKKCVEWIIKWNYILFRFLNSALETLSAASFPYIADCSLPVEPGLYVYVYIPFHKYHFCFVSRNLASYKTELILRYGDTRFDIFAQSILMIVLGCQDE